MCHFCPRLNKKKYRRDLEISKNVQRGNQSEQFLRSVYEKNNLICSPQEEEGPAGCEAGPCGRISETTSQYGWVILFRFV